MKTYLLIATMALATGALPLAARAQEALQEPSQAPAPQRLYVSDKLVLNVYAQADQSGGRVATIQTGDSVEELERQGTSVHVRLEDGREGWVGANYLTSDAPAAVRLRELQRGQNAPAAPAEPDKKSLEEIARLKKENTSLKGQVNELQSRVTAMGSIAEGAPEQPPSEPEDIGDEPDDEPAAIASSGPAWWIWSIAIVLTGALGYASGYQALARRLRRKFGGLKIY